MFGPLSVYRIELILAVLVLLVSLPSLQGSFVPKTPQFWALIGLGIATLLSVVVGEHWVGGSMPALLLFIPNAYAYLLVCLHCNSKRKLKFLVLMLLFVCLFVIAHGVVELQNGPTAAVAAEAANNTNSYLLPMPGGGGTWFYRLRGLGEIEDPNDFCQLIACVLPLVFIFWRPQKTLQNAAFVIVPVGALIYGAFLTHSRGGMLALIVMTAVAARRRIGTLPALLLLAGLYVAASALHFTGGRDISADAGQDRLDLWSDGIQILRSHPLFGVGYGNMMSYAENTAHNSIVVCAAELGLVGLYSWSLFLLPTIKDTLAIASPDKVTEAVPIESEKSRLPYGRPPAAIETLDKSEVNRLGQLMILSFTGFLVAAWFLSRAYVLTLFLLGGIVGAIFDMAQRQGMIAPRLPFARTLVHTGLFTISLLVSVYIMLRLGNLMR